jgi:hypothetical protein
MLRTAGSLKGYKIHASDGDLGRVEEFLFDDSRWVVRYLGVRTGGWLRRREVLLTPLAIGEVNWENRSIEVALTRAQVESSPPIESDRPVSRQKEIEYFDYYRLPYYWTGAGIFGVGPTGLGMPNPSLYELREREGEPGAAERAPKGDPHLRTDAEIHGYRIVAEGEPHGRVKDVVVDDRDWTVRYLLTEREGGGSGLVSPAWVSRISWEDREVRLDLTVEQLAAAPPFESMERLGREYETRLHAHYARRPYWHEGPAGAFHSDNLAEGELADVEEALRRAPEPISPERDRSPLRPREEGDPGARSARKRSA